MRVALLTSEVTFVPNNYHDFLLPLLSCPSVQVVVIVKNRNVRLFLKSLVLLPIAPRFASCLLKNVLWPQTNLLKKKVKELKKTFILVENPHTLSVQDWGGCDLLLHSRTRIYLKKSLRKIFKEGCWNIHHGRLPHQRGVMCDFWSFVRGERPGFTIHKMEAKIDAGEIWQVFKNEENYSGAYMRYLQESACLESQLALNFLTDPVKKTTLNQSSEKIEYDRNPSLRDIIQARLKGLKL